MGAPRGHPPQPPTATLLQLEQARRRCKRAPPEQAHRNPAAARTSKEQVQARPPPPTPLEMPSSRLLRRYKQLPLLECVAMWGDPSYSNAIVACMRDMAAADNGHAPPPMHGGPMLGDAQVGVVLVARGRI